MVYFYGGGFDWGSSDIFDGKYLAAFGDVIVVTLNYRLGMFGFLRLDDTRAPGNLGLWDQRLALQWINQHIGSFGGNTSQVTLFGNSVGGMSSIIHALYPNNTGLFQRIIAQSGSVSTLHYSMNAENTPEVEYVLKSLGCTSKNISDMLHCLRKIPARNFTVDAKRLSFEAKNTMLRAQFYVPNYDGTFINWNPRELWRIDDSSAVNSVEFFRSIDFLSGFDEYDAASVINILLNISDPEQFLPTEEEMKLIVVSALRMGFNKTFSDKVKKFVVSEYTDWNDPSNPESIRLQVVRLYTDMINAVPAVELSQIHARNPDSSSTTFMFLFTAKPTLHVLATTPSWTPGASHSDEMLFLAGMDRFPFASQRENELSYKLMKYWSNFAKYGNPNEAETSIPKWPTYELKNQEYIDLNFDITAKKFLNARAMTFWQTLLPELMAEETCEECKACVTSTAAVAGFLHGRFWLAFGTVLLLINYCKTL